jgi:DNA-binding transcriptional LysR family regulator
MSPFFMGEALEGARVAMRCDNPLIQLKAAASEVGIAEVACFLGDATHDVARIWPDEPPVLRPAWIIVHQDLRRSARIKVVSSAIADSFRHQSGLLRNGG